MIASGFFASGAVQTALLVGALVAAISAIVGVFTVLRGQSFAGHALADLGAVGGSAAFLVGANQLWGFVVAGLIAAGVMELVGVKRAQGRDVATGIVFGFGLGLTALFLYLDTTVTGASNAAISVLFGSLFVIDPSTVPFIVLLAIAAGVIMGLIGRRLLLDSLSQDMAAVRGVPVRMTGILFLIALAFAVELSSLSIGAVLSTALLIGPAATALRLGRGMGATIALAAAIGIGSTWAGIAVSYFSYYWTFSYDGTGGAHSWPVSFCIVVVVLLGYLVSGLSPQHRRQRRTLTGPVARVL